MNKTYINEQSQKKKLKKESGAVVSCSVPIIDEIPIKESIVKVPISRVDMIRYLIKLFIELKEFHFDEKKKKIILLKIFNEICGYGG